MFLEGYSVAAEEATAEDAAQRLADVPSRFRGFAYEGVAMAYAVLDGLPFGSSRHVERFLAGPGADHVYMAYVGVGWAMARLPRFRWRTLHAPDPLLSWLVLDGYGFHQAYFHTDRYVHGQYQESGFPWPQGGPQWYADRAIDQGIGRAMWFVGGTDVDQVTTMLDRFPEHRRADLYSGAGLAASYAGGVNEKELRLFWQRAGEYRPQVAQACAFAAEARVRAGLVVPHTTLATKVFCGMSPQDAARVSAEARPDPTMRDDLPAYEVWRQRIANQFVSLGRK